MGWFGCVLIGTLTKVQVFGGLREGIGFCISDCSLLCWLVIDLRPLWDRAWLWSLWAMKLVLKILYLIFFFFFCLMFSFAYSLVFGNKNFKFKCRSVSLIDNKWFNHMMLHTQELHKMFCILVNLRWV